MNYSFFGVFFFVLLSLLFELLSNKVECTCFKSEEEQMAHYPSRPKPDMANKTKQFFISMVRGAKKLHNKGIVETTDSLKAVKLLRDAKGLSVHNEKHVCRGYYDQEENIIRSEFINAEKICYKALQHPYNIRLKRGLIRQVKVSKCADKAILHKPDNSNVWEIITIMYIARCHVSRPGFENGDYFYVGSTPRKYHYYIFEDVTDKTALNNFRPPLSRYVEVKAIIRTHLEPDEYRKVLDYIQWRMPGYKL